MRLPTCQGKAYFTAGTRIWVSALQRGTYSLDIVRRAWRKEGDWELPFCHRGLVVPELVGLCSQRYLCACDIQQSPPAVRYAWPETFPRWSDETINCMHPDGCLAYLGDDKFCLAWTMAMHGVDDKSVLLRAIHLTAVEIIKSSGQEEGRELRLVKHKVCCYEMPIHDRVAYPL